MSSIMRQYGKAIIAVLAAVLVLGIAFRIHINGKKGFIEAAYAKAMEDMDTADVRTFADADAVKAAAARAIPEITFSCAKILPQTDTDIGAMLTAKDADGSPISCELLDITDASGNSILDEIKTDRNMVVRFPSVGIYVMKVKAADCEQKTATAQFRVPVTGN